MKVEIHADEVFDEIRPYPGGVYVSRATVYPDDEDEPYDIQWALELKDSTLYYSWPGMRTGPINA